MKLKKLLSVILTSTFILANSQSTYAAPTNTTKISINGEIRGEGFIEAGITYIPLRNVSETLGASVDWDATTKTVTLSKDYTTIVQRIGSDTARVNNKIVPIGAAAQIKNGITYVPLRFVSENLGAGVHWDSKTKIVQITADGVANKEDLLREKYLKLSEKTRDMTEFKAVPVTEYTTWDKVPQNARGYRFDKIRFIEMKDLPIKVNGDDIYSLEIGTLDNGVKVLEVTTRVTNRSYSTPFLYASKEKGLLTKRDAQINGTWEDIVRLDDNTFIIKQKYHLPNHLDGINISQVEYIVFYDAVDKDSIAIKNPFK